MKPILQYPEYESVLRQRSDAVTKNDYELISDMAEYKGECLGLSAVQLGVPVRLIMVKYGPEYIFLVNPEILKLSPQTWPFPEGCLSIKHGRELATFHRPKRVKVRYMDLEGNQRTIKAEGLTARALQHEIDHLEGRLIIDYQYKGGIREDVAWALR